jgi:hypothetical protein
MDAKPHIVDGTWYDLLVMSMFIIMTSAIDRQMFTRLRRLNMVFVMSTESGRDNLAYYRIRFLVQHSSWSKASCAETKMKT